MVIWELSIWSSSIDDLPRATTKRMIWCHDIASDPKMPYLVSSHHIWDPHSMSTHQWIICVRSYMAVCQNLVPLVNIKIAGKWMFIPLKMVLIGIDPYPYNLYATILSWTIFKLKPPIMWDLVTHSIPTQLWLPIHNAQILGFWCFRTFFWSVKKNISFSLTTWCLLVQNPICDGQGVNPTARLPVPGVAPSPSAWRGAGVDSPWPAGRSPGTLVVDMEGCFFLIFWWNFSIKRCFFSFFFRIFGVWGFFDARTQETWGWSPRMRKKPGLGEIIGLGIVHFHVLQEEMIEKWWFSEAKMLKLHGIDEVWSSRYEWDTECVHEPLLVQEHPLRLLEAMFRA